MFWQASEHAFVVLELKWFMLNFIHVLFFIC